MSATQITRCPHCQTSFRVSAQQLTVAKGAVRCGSCLQVFKAADHFIADPKVAKEVTKQAAKAQAKPKPAAKPEQQVAAKPKPAANFDDIPDQINDDPLVDFNILQSVKKPKADSAANINLDDNVFNSAFGKATRDESASIRSAFDEFEFLDFDEQLDEQPAQAAAETKPDADEAWAEALLADDTPAQPEFDEQAYVQARQEEYQDDFYISDSEPDSSTDFTTIAQAPAPEPKPAVKAKPQAKAPSPAPAKAKAKPAKAKAKKAQPVEDEFANFNGFGDELAEDSFSDTQFTDEPFAENFEHTDSDALELGIGEDDTELMDITSLPGTDIHDIREEPLALELEKQKSRAAIGWAFASLIMLASLFGQFAFFNFEQLAAQPNYRPYYQSACEIIGCRLPSIQNVKQMGTQHLVVRTHPKYMDALVVDSILINRSNFVQPFPNIELIFTGLNDEVIASRQFRPDQYLAGELSGSSEMPSKTPIHISLNIQDPGPEAVNYRLQLVANQ